MKGEERENKGEDWKRRGVRVFEGLLHRKRWETRFLSGCCMGKGWNFGKKKIDKGLFEEKKYSNMGMMEKIEGEGIFGDFERG